MACCAFAVFVLSQVLAPFVWVRRKLFGAEPGDNAAVAWSPGGIAVAATPSPSARGYRSKFTILAAAVALELLLGAAAIVYVAPRTDAAWAEAGAFDARDLQGAALEEAALEGAWCRAIAARFAGRN